MNLPTTDIIPILPSLRRYASALTGSARSGDEYIRVALETIVQEPWRLPVATDIRPELYALLHRTLDVCHFEDLDSRDGLDGSSDLKHQLMQLPLVDREVLLLVDLEGFALHDAAELLGLPEFEAAWRLTGARRALRARRGTIDATATELGRLSGLQPKPDTEHGPAWQGTAERLAPLVGGRS